LGRGLLNSSIKIKKKKEEKENKKKTGSCLVALLPSYFLDPKNVSNPANDKKEKEKESTTPSLVVSLTIFFIFLFFSFFFLLLFSLSCQSCGFGGYKLQ
jgi:ABC-type Na+ efflux pump permease subunit